MNWIFIAIAMLISTHAFASTQESKPCTVGVKVQFAKVASDGKREPLPKKREELIYATAYMSASTWVNGVRYEVHPTLMDVDNGTVALSIPACHELTNIRLRMNLGENTSLDYKVDYRPVFIVDGKEFGSPWGHGLNGHHEWDYSRLLPDLMEQNNYP